MCYSFDVEKTVGLRTKLYVMILPLILAVVMVSGVLSSLASRSALTPLATRLLAYKAEQLRDFVYSEWETIEDLGLAGNADYIIAAEESFRSYASSLLRTDTELIVVVGRDGETVMTVGAREPEESEVTRPLAAGWFSGTLLGEERVGMVFSVEPYGWDVALTELRAVFFTDAREIFRTHIVVSIGAVLLVTILVWLFVGFLVKPVERLTTIISRITATQDLSQRVSIESSDEVGLLGYEFNNMISFLESSYEELDQAMQAESVARATAVMREEETLLMLARASEFRDRDTGDHLNRIAVLTEAMARYLEMDDDEVDLLRRASALHDIGKIGIPDSILLKPGRLTEEEFEHMKRHTTIGYQLLKDAKSTYLVKGAEIALSHHEKWDGTGYPAGISGADIPLSGRIVSVVDVFDALTSDRPYKEAWSPERARDLIGDGRGRHFDPQLADLFLDHFPELVALIQR